MALLARVIIYIIVSCRVYLPSQTELIIRLEIFRLFTFSKFLDHLMTFLFIGSSRNLCNVGEVKIVLPKSLVRLPSHTKCMYV